jgi:hypothetical protein
MFNSKIIRILRGICGSKGRSNFYKRQLEQEKKWKKIFI